MMSRWYVLSKRGVLILLLGLGLAADGGRAYGNGWEHGAIPYSALVDGLADGTESMRYRAAQSLGFRAEKRSIEPLLSALKRPERSVAVRSAIYTAFGRLGDRRAVPALTDCLADEDREELRGDCAAALGAIASTTALEPLVAAFRGDPSFLVKTRVVDALGNFDAPAAVDLLTEIAGERRTQSLAVRAFAALGRTGSPDAVPVLINALARVRSPETKRVIVEGLGRLKAGDAAGEVAVLADRAGDIRLRVAAIAALGTIREGDGLPTLIKLLKDPSPSIRVVAIRALAARGDDRATLPIAHLVMHVVDDLASQENAELLSTADQTLASLSIQLEGLRALIGLDQSSATGAFLAAAYGRGMPRNSSTALRLAEGFYEVRRLAIYGLGYTKSDAARELLAGSGGIGSDDPRIRQVAVRSLGVLGGSDAVHRLVPLLDDPSADVRRMSAIVLGRLGDATAADPLIKALGDGNALVRREAALGLGYLRAPQSVAGLTRIATSDPDNGVRDAARFALGRIGD